jgi:hypothetical protein
LYHLPEQAPALERVPMTAPVLLSLVKSADECASIKAQCVAAAKVEVAFLSTNDAVCAEVVTSLGLEADQIPMNMLLDYRHLVGGKTVFGNCWMSLELLVSNSLAAAADIRSTLPVAQSADFVRWQMGQGGNASWTGKLFMNTWTKAFKLADLTFANPAADVMVGIPMLQTRAAMMAPVGVSYCITLPQRDGGLKMVGVMPAAAAEKLVGKTVTVAA